MEKKSRPIKSEWGDSFAVSKGTKPIKARILSSHPAAKKAEEPVVEKQPPVTAQLDQKAINELKDQWTELSQEMSKATGSLVHGIDHIAAKTIEGGTTLFVTITNGIVKIITFPIKIMFELFSMCFRPLLSWIKGDGTSSEEEYYEEEEGETESEDFAIDSFAESEDSPGFITFGTLADEGILFYTVKNETLSNLLTGNKPLTLEEDMSLLDKGIEEIKKCAKMSGSLPTPVNGNFANIPMPQILESVTHEFLQNFFRYVHRYPKPFMEKKIKLAEAYATWAYKGAPVD